MLLIIIIIDLYIFTKYNKIDKNAKDVYCMAKKEKNVPNKLYDLIPSQDAMYLMFKYGIHKNMSQIPSSFTIKTDMDFDILQKAFNIVIERNDCLRLRFLKVGKELKQYFREPYTYEIPMLHFDSLEEQDEFFSKDAKKPVMFTKDEIFRAYFYKTKGANIGLYINFTHLVIDAMGISNFFLDYLDVYNALFEGRELPPAPAKYEDYIIEEHQRMSNRKKMERHERFYKEYFLKGGEPYYAGIHGGEFLDKYRKKKKNPDLRVPLAYNPIYDKCDMITKHIAPEDAKKIAQYCIEKQIAPESIFQFGLRCHCSKVNSRINDVSMMAVCSKRATKKEKTMCGCLAQPIQIRTILSEGLTFDEAINEMVAVRTSLYRHVEYPYTKARTMSLDIYGFSPIQGPNSMMFSWIPLPVEGEFGFDFEFKTYNLGRYFTPLYTITMPDPEDLGINMCYMYRTKLSTKEDIELLHKNTVKAIVMGIENPSMTLGEILDGLCE